MNSILYEFITIFYRGDCMTLKSFFICIIAIAFLLSICPPLSAEKTGEGKQEQIMLSQKAYRSRVAVRQDANYWFDKGALCSTYGNNEAAVKYFQRAIALDPNRSGAYFAQGVSYGQLGQYKRALALIDKAIQLKPNYGLYYYGRGRVHLLAGDKESAIKDFKKAATLNDEDAMDYLDTIAEAK
jgi:tetratricopeptide (TPR) repeat protein